MYQKSRLQRTSYHFDTQAEQYLVHMVKGSFVQQICMFALVESHHIPGTLVYNAPPEEAAPHGRVRIVNLEFSRYDKIAARFEHQRKSDVVKLKQGIGTRNVLFNKLISEIERVAISTNRPILLLGPTGSGKSKLAERIFQLRKERRLVSGDFVALDCSSIRGEEARSALFGHVPGAFTGARQRRGGLMLAADKGLLFIDEIGDLGLEEQTLLLRALDIKRFRPFGADTEETSDFHLITATNKNLGEAVRNGTFRADLWARINVWQFELPGLRERSEDIEPNLDYELNRWRLETKKHVRMSSEVKAKFLRFATSPGAKWTGNFRDLIGAVERMATLAEDGIITSQVLDGEIERLKQRWQAQEETDSRTDALLLSLLGHERFSGLSLFERIQLLGVVEVCRTSRTAAEAGRRLFEATDHEQFNPSDRIRKFLKRFDLSFDQCGKPARFESKEQ